MKIPDVYTKPDTLRDDLQNKLGQFPLFNFWGPNTQKLNPANGLPIQPFIPIMNTHQHCHLFTCRISIITCSVLGRGIPMWQMILEEIDRVCGKLIDFYEQKGVRVIVLSEYGIDAADRPVHLNRLLREEGYITVREEMGGEILIPGTSRAFAVADHQIAHIYIKDTSDISRIKLLLEAVPGVDRVLDESGKKDHHLNHPRSGELIAIAEPDAWFTYYYWLDDSKAPDFAPTVAIHDKPGYDPAELLIDPAIRLPMVKAGLRLLQKKLGFRYKMDLIPINGSGVKGSHGRIPKSPDKGSSGGNSVKQK